jgi:hypothetical protein
MGQLYMQRFEYRGAISKSEFDATWSGALETFAKSGNLVALRLACVTSRLTGQAGAATHYLK